MLDVHLDYRELARYQAEGAIILFLLSDAFVVFVPEMIGVFEIFVTFDTVLHALAYSLSLCLLRGFSLCFSPHLGQLILHVKSLFLQFMQ